MAKNRVRVYKCHWCDADITFDRAVRSKNDKPIPLNLADHRPHDCPESPYNKRKQAMEQQREAAAAS